MQTIIPHTTFFARAILSSIPLPNEVTTMAADPVKFVIVWFKMNTGINTLFFPHESLFAESVFSRGCLDSKGLFNQLFKDQCSCLHPKELATAAAGNKQ